jgi:hypothetical protein
MAATQRTADMMINSCVTGIEVRIHGKTCGQRTLIRDPFLHCRSRGDGVPFLDFRQPLGPIRTRFARLLVVGVREALFIHSAGALQPSHRPIDIPSGGASATRSTLVTEKQVCLGQIQIFASGVVFDQFGGFQSRDASKPDAGTALALAADRSHLITRRHSCARRSHAPVACRWIERRRAHQSHGREVLMVCRSEHFARLQ